jgi:hypothetical protein
MILYILILCVTYSNVEIYDSNVQSDSQMEEYLQELASHIDIHDPERLKFYQQLE